MGKIPLQRYGGNRQCGPGGTPPPRAVLRWRCTKKQLFSFLWILQKMWSNWSRGNFWGVQVPAALTRRIYRDGYYNLGSIEKDFVLVLKFSLTG